MDRWPNKDPDDVLDYGIDWTAEIAEGDSIATSEWLPDDGLTAGETGISGTITTVWLSGGQDGRVYRVTNRVTTAAGRRMDRSAALFVTSR